MPQAKLPPRVPPSSVLSPHPQSSLPREPLPSASEPLNPFLADSTAANCVGGTLPAHHTDPSDFVGSSCVGSAFGVHCLNDRGWSWSCPVLPLPRGEVQGSIHTMQKLGRVLSRSVCVCVCVRAPHCSNCWQGDLLCQWPFHTPQADGGETVQQHSPLPHPVLHL